MSWLTAVTGKAEDFLNRLDKSAAEAFHADEDELGKEQTGGLSSLSSVDPTTLTSVPSYSRQLSSSQSVPSRLHKLNPDSTMPPATSTNVPATSANVPATSTPKSVLKTAPTSVMKSTVSAGKPGVKRNSDEALFDFLNSKDSAEAVKKPLTPGSSGHSRQSSTSSTRGISKTSDVALEASSTVTAAITSETAGMLFWCSFLSRCLTFKILLMIYLTTKSLCLQNCYWEGCDLSELKKLVVSIA